MRDVPRPRFDRELGIEWVDTNPDAVTARIATGPQHLGPGGAVHNGVLASLAETVASYAAAVRAMQRGPGWGAVGLENHTQVLTPVSPPATLLARAVPLLAGGRSPLWQVDITREEDGTAVSRTTVRLLAVETTTLPGA